MENKHWYWSSLSHTHTLWLCIITAMWWLQVCRKQAPPPVTFQLPWKWGSLGVLLRHHPYNTHIYTGAAHTFVHTWHTGSQDVISITVVNLISWMKGVKNVLSVTGGALKVLLMFFLLHLGHTHCPPTQVSSLTWTDYCTLQDCECASCGVWNLLQK